ncbi:MAG: hypothetical protein GX147_08895 [Deltaproteobacteria bacterium]|nr:hypothetical protein [Deltaproteobacteria bacterium]
MYQLYRRILLCFPFMWILFSLDAMILHHTAQAANPELGREVPGIRLAPPALLPSLIISQREIDLGTVAMGQEKEASFSIKHVGSDSLSWSIFPPDGWFPLEQPELAGISVGGEETVRLRMAVIKRDEYVTLTGTSRNLPVQMVLEHGSNRMVCVRDLPVGHYRDTIKIEGKGGIRRTLFVKINVIPDMKDTAIVVNPLRLDFGTVTVGEPVTRKLSLYNQSNENVKWQVGLVEAKEGASNFTQDRFISFANEDVVGKGAYTVPARLEKQLSLWGGWKEHQGFPSPNGKSVLKLDFYGGPLALYVKNLSKSGQLSFYIDNSLIKTYEFSDADADNQFHEISISENLVEGPHNLTVALNGNGIAIEGIKLKRKDVLEGKRDWFGIFPASGFILRETDYIHVTLNPVQATHGIYTNTIRVSSNNGDSDIPVSYEIIEELPIQNIDIYRYNKSRYYLYISDQPREETRLTSKGFMKQGLAFTLFQPGTIGTVPFHRWYNPNTINQYFSHDYHKGSSLLGYVYEGAVGNIATSRLTHTRELYRWYNPKTRQHFFSLDAKGEGMTRRGYMFDGIAGYVK